VAHYRSQERFAAERDRVLRRYPTPFCPSAALPAAGSYVAREAAGTPILAVRGDDGAARAFRNACRHRGAQLAAGAGCRAVFACPYHGWTYARDGRLCHVPHESGFPGLDRASRGLVAMEAVERDGLVFVTQEAPYLTDVELPDLPGLLPPTLRLLQQSELEVAANWKILLEGFLEGYHIKSTHGSTFHPLQYDNLNVVETFGRNSRIAFPYRAVEKLRAAPPAERSAAAKLTYVYHLFPNAIVATFPASVFVALLEPLAIDRTALLTWVLGDDGGDAGAARGSGADLVADGAAEDRAVACAVQRGLGSGANECLEFGLFEGALTHFHRTLDAALDAGPPGRSDP
jgi:phenylpropionate dioxygenase-like ring-hydroxylating dioxygenase large terminal subunit